mgnify:CR=1 FL=1
MRIVFAGTQSVGKTTLVEDLRVGFLEGCVKSATGSDDPAA